MYGFQQAFNARRLEAGEPTINIALAGLIASAEAIDNALNSQVNDRVINGIAPSDSPNLTD